MRFIMPVILIAVSITVFFVFTNPLYDNVSNPGIVQLRAEVDSYNQALDNAKALENEKDKLTQKEGSIAPENLAKLQKLLPENIDNIRLILEIQKIALPYGMTLKDVKYNAVADKDITKSGTGATVVGGPTPGSIAAQNSNKDYGVWDLSFSTAGSYNNFLNFVRDLESNLRIVDISSIAFSSSSSVAGPGIGSSTPDSYKYDFKIKTYWLKN